MYQSPGRAISCKVRFWRLGECRRNILKRARSNWRCPRSGPKPLSRRTIQSSNLHLLGAFTAHRLPQELSRVPDDMSGLYLCRVMFPSDYRLGISNPENRSHEELSRGIGVTVRKLDTIVRCIHGSSLTGVIRGTKRKHINTVFELSATRVCESTAELSAGELSPSSPDELLAYVTAVRYAVDVMPPLYVGIAHKQSLQSRLVDHLEGRTALYAKLCDAGLSWEDTRFLTLSTTNWSFGRLRSLEKVMQSILKPVFSEA